MTTNTYPTVADIEQAKKDMDDLNKFVHSNDNSFTDSSGKIRLTMNGLIALTTQNTGN